MVSRTRCTNCKSYFDREEAFYTGQGNMQRICSEGCFNEWMEGRRRAARKPAKRARTHPTPKLPIAQRMAIRQRDVTCRWCGRPGQEVHHIRYRSEGGSDERSNLVLLCQRCHTRAHSSKAAFQPLLLAYVWLREAEGRNVTIPDVGRLLSRLGLLSELQQERLAG